MLRIRDLPPEFRVAIESQRKRQREAVDRFVRCAVAGDLEGFADAAEKVEAISMFPGAFKAIAQVDEQIPDRIRLAFLNFWIECGDSLRCEGGHDFLVKDALRRLLPPYRGPAITLYRGEGAWNRSRRTYGLSWTPREEVGRAFASGVCRTGQGGSVLLRTIAPPEAIICEVPADDDRYAEREFVVDRRYLGRVEVLERFSQVPMSASRGAGPSTIDVEA